jgi:hypothetical protein
MNIYGLGTLLTRAQNTAGIRYIKHKSTKK